MKNADDDAIRARVTQVLDLHRAAEVARRTGFSPKIVSCYRHGSRIPASFLSALSRRFGIRDAWLLRGEGSMTAPADSKSDASLSRALEALNRPALSLPDRDLAISSARLKTLLLARDREARGVEEVFRGRFEAYVKEMNEAQSRAGSYTPAWDLKFEVGDLLYSAVADPALRLQYLQLRAWGDLQQCRITSSLAQFDRAVAMAAQASDPQTSLEFRAYRHLVGVLRGSDLPALDSELLESVAHATRAKWPRALAALLTVHGHVLIHIGRLDEAVAAFARFEVLMPDQPVHFVHMMQILAGLGRIPEGRELIDRARQTVRGRRHLPQLQAILAHAEGKLEESESWCRQAMKQAGYPVERANIGVRWMRVAMRRFPKASWNELLAPMKSAADEVPMFDAVHRLGQAFQAAQERRTAEARSTLAKARAMLDDLVPSQGLGFTAPFRASAAWLALRLRLPSARRRAEEMVSVLDGLIAARVVVLKPERDRLVEELRS